MHSRPGAQEVHQPWAWLIVNGVKDIENRSRRTHYRGPWPSHSLHLESWFFAWKVVRPFSIPMEFHEQTSTRKKASGEDTTGQKTNPCQEASL
jgi:hypothetical protein